MTALAASAFPVFPAPALPDNAYRRSWMADLLQNGAIGEKFYDILKVLAPAQARRIGRHPTIRVFRALMAEIKFPVADIDEMLYQGDSWDSVLWNGIPVDVRGYHPDYGSAALELAAIDAGSYYFEKIEDCYAIERERLMPWMQSWWMPPTPEQRQRALKVRLPRGWQFVQPWDALPDLVRYACGETGNDWLDLNFEAMSEMNNPPWSVAEIRSLNRLWLQAQPIAQRVDRLVRFVDDERERLQTLHGALRGEREALEGITRAKPQPMWKSFSRTHR